MSPKKNTENVYTKFIGAYIKKETHRKLVEKAIEKRWSMAQVIRLVLEEYTGTSDDA